MFGRTGQIVHNGERFSAEDHNSLYGFSYSLQRKRPLGSRVLAKLQGRDTTPSSVEFTLAKAEHPSLTQIRAKYNALGETACSRFDMFLDPATKKAMQRTTEPGSYSSSDLKDYRAAKSQAILDVAMHALSVVEARNKVAKKAQEGFTTDKATYIDDTPVCELFSGLLDTVQVYKANNPHEVRYETAWKVVLVDAPAVVAAPPVEPMVFAEYLSSSKIPAVALN